jgi:hypothetical protein
MISPPALCPYLIYLKHVTALQLDLSSLICNFQDDRLLFGCLQRYPSRVRITKVPEKENFSERRIVIRAVDMRMARYFEDLNHAIDHAIGLFEELLHTEKNLVNIFLAMLTNLEMEIEKAITINTVEKIQTLEELKRRLLGRS